MVHFKCRSICPGKQQTWLCKAQESFFYGFSAWNAPVVNFRARSFDKLETDSVAKPGQNLVVLHLRLPVWVFVRNSTEWSKNPRKIWDQAFVWENTEVDVAFSSKIFEVMVMLCSRRYIVQSQLYHVVIVILCGHSYIVWS